MREIWSKQSQVLRIRTRSYELQLNWSFGETSLSSFSMMWTTRELAMTELQNELHTRTTLDRRWTYTRLENRSSPKGGHSGAIWEKLGACDTPKINASFEWQNGRFTPTFFLPLSISESFSFLYSKNPQNQSPNLSPWINHPPFSKPHPSNFKLPPKTSSKESSTFLKLQW